MGSWWLSSRVCASTRLIIRRSPTAGVRHWATGGATGDRDPAWPIAIVDGNGSGPLIWINPVPERKTIKNRMHLDVWGSTDG